MENLITRHRNVSILVAVLFAQVLGLAVQVKRSSNNPEDTRLIRIWAISAVTPLEKAILWMQHGTGGIWHNYIYLRGLRAENRDLKQEIERMHLEQVRLSEDAEQARRLQLLLGFKEKFISKTVAAQVIGSSGSEQSRSIYIDKGSRDGIEPDQAVITAEGVVGKVLHVYGSTSLVLLINDQTSGVGVILEKSRLQGVLRGTPLGGVAVEKVMNEESVQPGEHVITSGGDQIFPKGLDIGTVSQVRAGSDAFLSIRVKPAANLSKLEEVLVVTGVETKLPRAGEMAEHVRAVDILTQRLPSVPEKPAVDPKKAAAVPGIPAKTPAAKPPGAGLQGAATATAGTPGATAKPAPASPLSANKPLNPSVAVPGKPPISQAQPAIPNAAVKKPTTADTAAAKVGQAGVGTKTPGGTAAAKPAVGAPNSLTPTPASGIAAPVGSVKPALVQKPAIAPKTAAPANKPENKSARPMAPETKPEPAPVEDKPQ
jgi:rod shape-determining protein MreC